MTAPANNNQPPQQSPPAKQPAQQGSMSATLTSANKQSADTTNRKTTLGDPSVITEDCPKCGGHNPDCPLCHGTGKIKAEGVAHTPPTK